MSVSYTWVGWTRQKLIYDAVLIACIAAYLALFIAGSRLFFPPPADFSMPIVAVRALGTCAVLLLHVVLWIGPLARLDRRFLPLLYNRRHLGVATFCTALAHAAVSTGWYHGFGDVNPLISLLSANTAYDSLARFPFEMLGLGALLVLFLMAATSHDFWLRNLGARAWKSIHMLVYPAYGLVVMHIALGALQSERAGIYVFAVLTGAAVTAGLHLAAAQRELRADRATLPRADPAEGFVDAGAVGDLPPDRARIVSCRGERIAIFRTGDAVSAVTNVCAHQGGPLGEGRIVDGCITCPWHGWQYRPTDGCSPPPFQEKIATYRVRVEKGRVLVDPRALPPGTPVLPAPIGGEADGNH